MRRTGQGWDAAAVLSVAGDTSHHAPAIVVICAAVLLGFGVILPAGLAAYDAFKRRRDERRLARRALVDRDAQHTQAEVEAFIAVLHTEIGGAQDFLARTRSPTPARRGRSESEQRRAS